MALLLPLLMLGPWSPLASAQAVTRCPLPNSQICGAFETNVVTAFLQAHGIPTSEVPLIYQYGRTDLRNEVRANLFANILAIVKKDSSTRTADEQAIYNWIQNVVWTHEQEQFAAAIADRDTWKAHPCTWTPDPDVAKQFNLSYDGGPWCDAVDNLSALFSIAPPVPGRDYFLTTALKKSYGQKIGTTAGGSAVMGGVLESEMAAAGVAAAGGLAVGGGVGAFLTTQFLTGGLEHLVPLAAEAIVEADVEVATETVIATFGAEGPFAIITAGVLIGSIAAMEVYDEQKTLAELATLTTDYNWNLANKPRLENFVNDPLRFHKIELSLVENTLPDSPSSALPPGRRSGDRNFIVTPNGGTPVLSPTFTYLDWAATKWTAQPSGGWISAQGVKKDNTPDSNFGVSIKFKGWDGALYTAGRNDLQFIVSKFIPASADKPFCAPDSTGNTPGDVSKCAVYITHTLKLLDANGAQSTVRFTSFPLFTSPTTLPADLTTTTQLSITADGDPAPTISISSALPNGFSFNATSPGKAQLTITPAASPASYNLMFTADNGGGSPATQTLTIVANVPVQIQGPDNYSVYAGQPFSQVIAVAGSPKPTLTCTGNSIFNATATFVDHHDGTGTISGTLGQETRDVSGNPQSPLPVQCDILADNGLTHDEKLISIFGILPPAATITSATAAIWVDNDNNELLVTTTVPAGSLGTPKVSFSFPCAAGTPNGKPDWMTFKDNGNGTAVLSGRPPFGTTSVPLLLFVSTGELPRCFSGISNTGNGFFNVPIPPDITITVRHVPALPDPTYQFLSAGVPVNSVGLGSPAGGDGTVSGTPPPGIVFTGGALSTWHLSGTPPVGSGGEYDMLYTATGGGITASEIFQLLVLEAPKIVSLKSGTFRTGQDNGFDVTTTGFPQQGIQGLRDPMHITVQGVLPQGVVFTDTSAGGVRTGAGVFSGNPPLSARGTYPLTLTASNGVVPDFVQNFTLVVAVPGDANNDGVVNCSDLDLVGAAFGYYRGNAKYNPNADVNNDGVINFADATIVESHLPPGNSCVFAMGFSTMSAAVTANGAAGNFDLNAAFTLNAQSNGINPASEAFSLQVGGFNTTLPGGSFTVLQNGAKQGTWVYGGTVGGVSLNVQLQPAGATAFQVKATASGGSLSPLTSPVPVRIRIGDDGGTVSVVPSK